MKTDPITGEPIYKARGTCNGSGKAVTLAETHATCVAQPACRVYWSITASEGLLAFGVDAGNAFAEAPPLSNHSICVLIYNFWNGGLNPKVMHQFQRTMFYW
jgi:hypothetical protein